MTHRFTYYNHTEKKGTCYCGEPTRQAVMLIVHQGHRRKALVDYCMFCNHFETTIMDTVYYGTEFHSSIPVFHSKPAGTLPVHQERTVSDNARFAVSSNVSGKDCEK